MRLSMIACMAMTASLLVSAMSGTRLTPFKPPAYPLAVRSPYLSAWLPGGQASDLPSSEPEFWFGNAITWSVMARIDDTTYNVFGLPNPISGTQTATVVSGSFTSTYSTFILTAGNANVTLDFFSPVSTTDFSRQSLPFAYLTVTVNGLDGNAPSVQIYSDIDDSWTGTWGESKESYHQSVGDTSFYYVSNLDFYTYAQDANEMPLWGQAIYATNSTSSSTLTAQAGSKSTVRTQFVDNGSLSGAQPAWSSGAVTAFAQDLGTVSNSESVVFSIGHIRNSTINYLGAVYTHYYRATYLDIVPTVQYAMADYAGALAEAAIIDDAVQVKGTAAGGKDYAAVLALSVRQAFGGTDVVIPESTMDTSNAYMFLKEISSDGNAQTVDVIFPAFPIFYVLAPEYIRLLIAPVLDYIETGAWPEAYCVHDLGTAYPNATGHDNGSEENMPIEETGNIIQLALAYQKASGNTAFAAKYKTLLQSYADYLVTNGEYPAAQLSTNDFLAAAPNQTNLGIKAAVGLTAFGELFSLSNYTTIGQSYAAEITSQGLGLSSSGGSSFFNVEYGSTTWFMVFNLYPDILLSLNTFPQSAYNDESSWYPTVRGTWGLPIDGNQTIATSMWQMWSAAAASSTTQATLIADLYKYVSNGLNSGIPLPDRYTVNNGEADGFRNRPVVGGYFAPMALNGANILA